jgi:rRNA biogenesis protein RRP5
MFTTWPACGTFVPALQCDVLLNPILVENTVLPCSQVFSVKDLYPGQLLNVTILDHTPAGVIVSITDTIKALVPRAHMSDTAAGSTDAKVPSKLKPGKTLPARVLSVNPITRRVEVTLKKGLLGSKLPVLAALKDAEAGMKLHGVVTGVEGYGVFVGFYGGLSGLMPNSQLDLLPGQEARDLYSKGQLLRCQVNCQPLLIFVCWLPTLGRLCKQSQ